MKRSGPRATPRKPTTEAGATTKVSSTGAATGPRSTRLAFSSLYRIPGRLLGRAVRRLPPGNASLDGGTYRYGSLPILAREGRVRRPTSHDRARRLEGRRISNRRCNRRSASPSTRRSKRRQRQRKAYWRSAAEQQLRREASRINP